MVHTLVLQVFTPFIFWVEALKTIVHANNGLPSFSIQNLTPFKLFYKRNLLMINYKFLVIFVTPVYLIRLMIDLFLVLLDMYLLNSRIITKVIIIVLLLCKRLLFLKMWFSRDRSLLC